jgi:hypothetical protein
MVNLVGRLFMMTCSKGNFLTKEPRILAKYFYGVEQISIICNGLTLWALMISVADLLHATHVAVFITLMCEIP